MRKEGINLTTILILLNAMTIAISRSDDGIINDEIGIFWKEKKKKNTLDRNWIGILILRIMSFRKLRISIGAWQIMTDKRASKYRLDLPRI